MPDIQSLKQERAELVDKARKIHDGEEVTDEEEQRFDRLMDEAESLQSTIQKKEAKRERLRKQEEHMEQRDRQIQSDPNVPDDIKEMGAEEVHQREMDAFRKHWTDAELTEEEERFLYRSDRRKKPRQELGPAYEAGDRDPNETYARMREQRAGQQSIGSSGAGGTFVPPGFQREIIETQKAFGGLENMARVIETPMGNDMDIPSADDTAHQGSIVGENSTIGNTTSVPTGNVTLESVKYQSGPILYSIELEQDSFTDINAFLRDKISERLGRVQASHFAQRSSTESNGPHGIINISTGAVDIVQGTTTLTPSKLRELIHSVDPAYRGNQNVGFLMNDTSLKNFAKLEDADGRPLWQPSLQQGVPDQILGFPVQIDQSMPSMSTSSTATTKPVMFGDMSRYAVRRVMDMRVFELRERHIETGQFGILAFQRADGRPLFHSTAAAAQKPIRAIAATTA